MKAVTIYEANDGKQFATRFDCEQYEISCMLMKLGISKNEVYNESYDFDDFISAMRRYFGIMRNIEDTHLRNWLIEFAINELDKYGL